MIKQKFYIPLMGMLFLPSTALGSDHPSDLIKDSKDAVRILNKVAGWMFVIFMALASAFIIYSAYLYLTAAGSQDKISAARKSFTWAIVAIVVALVAGSIPALIRSILGA